MLNGVMLFLLFAVQAGQHCPGLPTDPELRERTIARVLEKLHSDDAARVAWGAYQSGKWGLDQYVPELLGIVERNNASPSRASPFVTKMALDALVRLDAHVPAELLIARLDKEYFSETLILLAKHETRDCDALLKFVDGLPVDSEPWWATACVLAASRPAGLAKRLLNVLLFEMQVCVRDAEIPARRGGARIGHARTKFRDYDESFPPWPAYSFSTSSQEGSLVLQDGPVAVFYRRSEFFNDRPPESTTTAEYRSRLAFRCLQAMIEVPVEGFSLQKKVVVDWKNNEDYLRQVSAALTGIRSAYRNTLEKLVAQGLLTPEDSAGMKPDVQITVVDRRVNAGTELPEISDRE